MQALPHTYAVQADDEGRESVTLSAEGLTSIDSAAPKEFDGPGDRWSPETLLLAAVADCYTLSFRAVAKASNFAWLSLQCKTVGKLDRVDRVTRFTEINNSVVLRVVDAATRDKAIRLLHKAEEVCLISNSLAVDVGLQVKVEVAT